VWRDIRKLLLMYVMLQAYLPFMQFHHHLGRRTCRVNQWYVPDLATGLVDGVGHRARCDAQFVLQPVLALCGGPKQEDPSCIVIVCLCISFC